MLTEHGCKIASNTYYCFKKRPPSARFLRDEYLKVEIARVHGDNLSVYGADEELRCRRVGSDSCYDRPLRAFALICRPGSVTSPGAVGWPGSQ